jgi:2-desacetyl-2-hydroxyethyl bacteriochlorophyllide A dehydrogenase
VKKIEALVCVEPGKLEVQERAAPVMPDGFVLVRPKRVGICGTDYHIYEGKHPYLQYPRIMGHELAVEALQDDAATGVRAGRTYAVNPYLSCGVCVACRAGKPNCCVKISVLGVHQDGGMAQLMAVPSENLIQAEGLDADQCASVEFLAIGAHAVRRGQVQAGDTALIVGTGPIGMGAALFAKLSGAHVSIYDRDHARAQAMSALLGVQAISALEKDAAFSVVFDATGNTKAMEKGFDFVEAGGRYVFVSVVKDPITFMDPDFHRKEMTLLGSRNATVQDFERVIAAIKAGQVPIGKIITHRTTLASAALDLPRWASEKNGLIKAMIEIG